MRRLGLLLLTAIGCSGSDNMGRTTTPITGTVVDAQSGTPITGVQVTSTPETQTALTDDTGRYTLEDARLGDRYQIRAEADGYNPSTLTITAEITSDNVVDFALERKATCEPGALRCLAGQDSIGFETCVANGNGWTRTDCEEQQLCLEDNPGCTPAFRFIAIIDEPGGVVRSQPVPNQDGVINCGAACDTFFAAGTEVTLIATPLSQSTFVSWRGACGGTDPVCTITMDRQLAAGATFNASAFAVSVNNVGPGDGRVVSTPAGIDCPGTCSASFDRDSTVSLQATPEAGSQFDIWRDDCDGCPNPCVLTVDSPKDVRARFILPQQSLTVSKVGTGAGLVGSMPAGIDCGSECTAAFPEDSMVTLTATPAMGSTFLGFEGDCTGLVCNVTMDAARTVQARFDGIAYPLTVTLPGNGNGTVTSNPAGINCGADCDEPYGPGTMVTLTAAADPDSDFTGWGGDCAAAAMAADCVVTTDSPLNASATFTAVPFYERELAADGNCQILLRFNAAAPTAHECGAGNTTEVGTWTSVASRTPRLAEARTTDAANTNGTIDTQRLGPAPNSITVEVNVRKDGNAHDGSGRGVLFSDRDSNDPATSGLRLAILDDGRVVAETADGLGGVSTATTTGSLVDGTWAHVAATVDPVAGIQLFIDGVSDVSLAGPLLWTGSSSTAWVGSERQGQVGAIYRLQGALDELRVSSGARY